MRYLHHFVPILVVLLVSLGSQETKADGPPPANDTTSAQEVTPPADLITVYEHDARKVHFFLQAHPQRDLQTRQQVIDHQVYSVSGQLEPLDNLVHLATLTKLPNGTKQLFVADSQLNVIRADQDSACKFIVSIDPQHPKGKVMIDPQQPKGTVMPVYISPPNPHLPAVKTHQHNCDLNLPPQLLSRLDQLMSH